MFRQKVCQTMMTSEAADNFFQHITCESWDGDVSFVSTLRALVAPRMQYGEKIDVRFTETTFTSEQVATISARTVIRAIFRDEWESGTIVIHNFRNSSQENNYANLDLLKSQFECIYPEWHRLDIITDFFRKKFYALCFIQPETKRVALFIDNLDLSKLHYLQCAILAFLPWYFDPQKGVTEDEMALIQSLRDGFPAKYEEYITKIAAKYDFKADYIRKLLSGFETRFERAKCEEFRNSIATIDSEIDRLNTMISDLLRQRKESECTLCGLELKIEQDSDGDSEIMDYFLSNNALSLETVTDLNMVFVVKANCEYYDEDMA